MRRFFNQRIRRVHIDFVEEAPQIEQCRKPDARTGPDLQRRAMHLVEDPARQEQRDRTTDTETAENACAIALTDVNDQFLAEPWAPAIANDAPFGSARSVSC